MTENVHHSASNRKGLTQVLSFAFFCLFIFEVLSALAEWIGLLSDMHRTILHLVSVPTSLIAGILALLVVDRGGKLLPSLGFGGHRERCSPLERNYADLEKARHSYAERDLDHALQHVKGVLAHAPDLPEGLYLEAQILWEGFGNAKAAKSVLARLMKSVSKNETLYQLASNYLDHVSRT